MSNTHVRQLDRGMDLGPAHKNIALNHLVARGSRIPDGPNPAFERLVPGDEDDNPTACVKAIKAAREHTVEDLFSEPTAPQAYIMDSDLVLCEWCHEARNEDRGTNHMDNDPNYWLFKVMDWQPGHFCHDCGTTDGINCEEDPELALPQLP
jgi:hypothetical protein